MDQTEKGAYVLGTEKEELHRLGLQHQVWSAEARIGWKKAGFSEGQYLLDLGCGPGFCTEELAYMVGKEGKVFAVDKSAIYIDHLNKKAALNSLPVEAIQADFDNLELAPNSLDGIYVRWAFAWIDNPKEILEKLVSFLKPGGKIVFHEYNAWSTFEVFPSFPALQSGIETIYDNFANPPGDINIGKRLPAMFLETGLNIFSIRPMSKIATPDSLEWSWPKTFLHIFLPKLVDTGAITTEEVGQALVELEMLEDSPGASMLCPHMIEVIGEKK